MTINLFSFYKEINELVLCIPKISSFVSFKLHNHVAYKLPSILVDSKLFIDFPNMPMIIILHEYEKLTGAGKCFRNCRYFNHEFVVKFI